MAHIFSEGERTRDVTLSENVTFESLLLPQNILEGLKADGFAKPSPIQVRAIPVGRIGFDIVMRSKSGTGKTLVFAILALETIDVTKNVVQVLILTPTREIAVQIQAVIKKIGAFIPGLKVESFIGGLPIEDDKKKAKECHIAVGPPGRIKHLIESQFLKTSHIKLFVLDEADKLVEQNFQSDINQIFHRVPVKKQVIASSATYPAHLDTFLTRYMHCPTFVSADADSALLLGLKQYVSVLKHNVNIVQQLNEKHIRLSEILSKTVFTQCLVFTNYQTRAESVSNILNQAGWNSSFISAAQEQKKRLEVMESLKNFECRILLSTDLTSRGIDASNVDLVINFDVPYDAATYLHRMGRAGRFGSKGVCITLCCDGKELDQFKYILGVIGGQEMAVAKLDPVPSDLLNCDSNSFEMIHGEVNDAGIAKEVRKAVKDSLFNLKSESKRKVKGNKAGKKSEDKQGSDVDGEGESVEVTSSERRNENTKKPSEILDGKRKREKLLLKNTVVYNISKLWSDKHEKNDDSKQQLLNSVENYLQDIENEDKITVAQAKQRISNMATEEVLKNIDLYCQESDEEEEEVVVEEIIEEPENNSTALEMLFQSAFAHACGQSEKHWMDFFSADYKIKFEAYCNSSPESDDEDDEEDAYEAMETSGSDGQWAADGAGAAQQGKPKSRMLGEPVFVNSPAEQQGCEFTERFCSYFEECGKKLEETALTFEDLASFDEWYYSNWQTQVGHVREFVRQNVYVHEMRQYQDERLKKHKEQ